MSIYYLIHLAAEPKEGVQRCFRCECELARSPLSFWEVGHDIAQQIRQSDDRPTGGWCDVSWPDSAGVDPGDKFCVASVPDDVGRQGDAYRNYFKRIRRTIR